MKPKGSDHASPGPVIWLLLAACLLLPAAMPAMVLAQEEVPVIRFEWPNEGETLYAGPSSLLYSIPVRGWILGADLDPAQITVHLEIVQDGQVTGALARRPEPDGRFEFLLTVNPAGSDGDFPAEHLTCSYDCHLAGFRDLPGGRVTLRVMAVDGASGRRSSAERHVTVDRSGLATVPVQVELADPGSRPVAGIQVSGSTWLYLWRARNVSAATDQNGLALVSAEALSEAPTRYIFRVVPTIVDGILYQGLEPVSVELPPGATSIPPITLTAEARAGAIRGQVSFPGTAAADSPSLLAIELPAGRAHPIPLQTNGSFELWPLPIGDYLVTLDSATVPRDRFASHGEVVDLTQVHEAELDLAVFATEGIMVGGQVVDLVEGTPLPFAWVAPRNSTRWQPASPTDGTFLLTDLPEKPPPLLVGAPGYYSQLQDIEASVLAGEPVNIGLARQEGTRSRPWGGGEVVIPAESQTSGDDGDLRLERGWLWGQGGDQSLSLRAGGTEVTLRGGAFALEYLPGRRGWLYLLEGGAQLSRPDLKTGVALEAGQMINLLNPEGLVPVSCEPGVINALQPTEGPPLSYVWQPTLKALVQRWLAEIGIGAAQLLTLATYLAVISSTVVVPAALLIRWRRRKLAHRLAEES